MSRTCKYLGTTTETPCENLVGNLEDHCAAGHPCPPTGSGTPAVAQSHVPVGPGAPFDLDDLVCSGPSPAPPASDEKSGADEKLHDADRASQTAAYFALDTGFPIEYVGTERGERKRLAGDGTAQFWVDRFKLGSAVVAHGERGNGPDQWYAETPCTDDGCTETAYVRLRHTSRWWGKALPPDPQKRRNAFLTSAEEAAEFAPTASCDQHRAPLHADDPDVCPCGESIADDQSSDGLCGNCSDLVGSSQQQP